MLGVKHIKFDSSVYVVHYKNGKIKNEGRGLSFYYYSPNSSIVAIPFGTDDVQFIFNEVTSDFQDVSIQGQITYKVINPKQLAESLDFTVDVRGKYKTNDKEKLSQRLINEAQTATSSFIKSLNIKVAIRSATEVQDFIIKGLQASKAVQMLGIEPLSVSILGIKPTPVMSKALEAQTREALQQEADKAIYDRRNFAVEQERKIKESELSTEIAVEEKKKQISEKKMESEVLKTENERKLREMGIDADSSAAVKKAEADFIAEENNRKLRQLKTETDISIETQRQQFVDINIANKLKEADAKAYEIDAYMKIYKTMDWRILMALNNKNNAADNIALAFRELAENAKNINNLNITPDLLQSILESK